MLQFGRNKGSAAFYRIGFGIGPTPPVDPSALTFLAIDMRSPKPREYPGSEGGRQVYYLLRWVNTRYETGPWSETATIGSVAKWWAVLPTLRDYVAGQRSKVRKKSWERVGCFGRIVL